MPPLFLMHILMGLWVHFDCPSKHDSSYYCNMMLSHWHRFHCWANQMDMHFYLVPNHRMSMFHLDNMNQLDTHYMMPLLHLNIYPQRML